MNPFSLALVVKIIGWVLVLGPIAAVVTVSLTMILGAAKDDATIGSLVTLGFSLFFLGAAMLVLAYFTNLLTRFI